MITVLGHGSLPNPVMLVGEAPGRQEANSGRPFAGRSGAEQENYLARHNYTARHWYMTNVCKEYIEDNPDPTPEQVAMWGPMLVDEIAQCQPQLIIAVGRFAARWFLGESASMRRVHGMPHIAGCFDPSRSTRAPCPVIPIYHPASGIHQLRNQTLIAWDYAQVCKWLDGKPMRSPQIDPYPNPTYIDVTGDHVELYLRIKDLTEMGFDTEGTPDNPWSLQFSCEAGTGYALRCTDPHFDQGIAALQAWADDPSHTIIMHNAMYDIPMARAMGLELSLCNIIDTMDAGYVLSYEGQGLKDLTYRFCGMEMQSYLGVVSDAGREKQVAYLLEAAEAVSTWPKPNPRQVRTNDGVIKTYKPGSVAAKIKRILVDLGQTTSRPLPKLDKDGNRPDPHARWYKHPGTERYKVEASRDALQAVEDTIGYPMPGVSLADVLLSTSIPYATTDAVGALRLWPAMVPELEALDLTPLMRHRMANLRCAEEIQATGMPVDRDYFIKLEVTMISKAHAIQDDLIATLGRPFNPGSWKQVAEVLEDRGLKGLKKTPSGGISTAKPSIEHLTYEDEVVRKIFEYREHMHIADSFCRTVIDRTRKGETFIHPQVQRTRTTSQRYAMRNPNLMNIPVRTELGMAVRDGYRCPPGYTFLSVDYGQIEPRVAAHLSRDQKLTDVYLNNRDLYTETAADLFDLPVSAAGKGTTERAVAKVVTLGVLYGMAGETLKGQLWAQDLRNYDSDQCDEMIAEWYQIYSGVAQFKRDTIQLTVAQGYIRDHSGMYRYLPAITSDNSKARAEAERHCVSHLVQGMAQTIMQAGMDALHMELVHWRAAGHSIHMCLQMHDEIILLVPDTMDIEMVKATTIDCLVNRCGVVLSVPLVASGVTGTRWSELKD